MIEKNEEIKLTGDKTIEILKEINLILVSLHSMGSYYINSDTREYEKETTRFIDEWRVTNRLARIREILSRKFNNTLGDDDMDDIERELENLIYWERPGDIPPNEGNC